MRSLLPRSCGGPSLMFSAKDSMEQVMKDLVEQTEQDWMAQAEAAREKAGQAVAAFIDRRTKQREWIDAKRTEGDEEDEEVERYEEVERKVLDEKWQELNEAWRAARIVGEAEQFEVETEMNMLVIELAQRQEVKEQLFEIVEEVARKYDPRIHDTAVMMAHAIYLTVGYNAVPLEVEALAEIIVEDSILRDQLSEFDRLSSFLTWISSENERQRCPWFVLRHPALQVNRYIFNEYPMCRKYGVPTF